MTWTFEKLFRKSGIADAAGINWSRNVKLKDGIEPFEHQLSGINLLCSYERAGIYDQTGTGKTLPIQAYALYYAGADNKVIALMPPALLTQFYDSFYDTFDNVEGNVAIEIFKGTPTQRNKQIARWNKEGDPQIIMMTYNLFRGTGKTIGYSRIFKDRGYNVLIADEAQALRNSSSKIHKNVYNFVGGKKDSAGNYGLVLSTGTPSHTHLEQNYGLIRLITPNAYGTKAAYERLHVVRNHASPFNEIVDYDNYDIMTINLYARARRVEKKDVAKNLPPKIHSVVPVELDPKHMKLYKRLLDERVLEFDGKFIDAIQDQALRQMALKLVTCPNDFSDEVIVNNMEAALLTLIDSIDMERTKVLIFIHFNSTADRLIELLDEYNPALVNGRVTNKDEQIRKFLKDDTCRAMVAHPLSAGSGLNLQSICSAAIFYETPDSPGTVTQAEDRIHRITGTKETVNVYFLSPTKTWAAKKITQVQKKDAIINRVIGDKSALLHDLFD